MPEKSQNANSLAQKKCVPCEGTEAPLTNEQEDTYLSAVPEWKIERSGTHQLVRVFELRNFAAALQLAQKIGAIAEREGHHPNLYLYDFKKLRVELYTHAIGGLSQNDFIVAVKVDRVY